MPRKKKDPEMPKRPLSSYMFYSKERRPKLQDEQPSLQFGEYSKLIAEEWKSMDNEAKEQYLELSKKDKDRYEEALKEYKEKKKNEPPPAEVQAQQQQPTYPDVEGNKNFTTQDHIDRHYYLQQREQYMRKNPQPGAPYNDPQYQQFLMHKRQQEMMFLPNQYAYGNMPNDFQQQKFGAQQMNAYARQDPYYGAQYQYRPSQSSMFHNPAYDQFSPNQMPHPQQQQQVAKIGSYPRALPSDQGNQSNVKDDSNGIMKRPDFDQGNQLPPQQARPQFPQGQQQQMLNPYQQHHQRQQQSQQAYYQSQMRQQQFGQHPQDLTENYMKLSNNSLTQIPGQQHDRARMQQMSMPFGGGQPMLPNLPNPSAKGKTNQQQNVVGNHAGDNDNDAGLLSSQAFDSLAQGDDDNDDDNGNGSFSYGVSKGEYGPVIITDGDQKGSYGYYKNDDGNKAIVDISGSGEVTVAFNCLKKVVLPEEDTP